MIFNVIKSFINKYIKKFNVKESIIAHDKNHLENLIQQEIKLHGYKCDLNHIDVSNITDMSRLFYKSKFNGNISKWDVSNVKDMSDMFLGSSFNGAISKWNVSNVQLMTLMFKNSQFNGDISEWDVSKVESMTNMFFGSNFTGDLSDWFPYNLDGISHVYNGCEAPVPYWAKINEKTERNKNIMNYQLNKGMNQELNKNNVKNKRFKI
jgi:hypothetical protein